MPYTPPLNRSPASSASSSPEASRRSSLVSGTRPSLPRSASYLRKHRRTPSVTIPSDASFGSLTPQGTSEDLPAMAASANSNAGGGSVRQSPPPVTDERGMPKGAVISPPDSASSGSDDDTPEIRGRKHTRLVGLRDAVNELALSTNSHQPPTLPRSHHSDNYSSQHPSEHHAHTHNRGMHVSFSTSSLPDAHKRRNGHVRSATEPNVLVTKSADNSMTASEEETDEELKYKPQMVRKKSGELVRPALRASSRRRPSSMPGTPVFSKAVHFDSHLEHVRHFLQVDRPLAVSAGSSPVDNHESETEFPFPGTSKSSSKGPPFEWEIITPNFPADSIVRKALPAKLERVWLSPDQKSLLGSIAVANLAFQKTVICRFTLDYWKTTSEVTAEYDQEIRPVVNPAGQDRFNFSIKLSDTINLESKTMFLCVRYSVNGQEYWDNNNSANFQVDFRKKYLPQHGKDGARGKGNNALPRSNRRRNTHDGRLPHSSSFSEFSSDAGLKYDQPIHEVLGETGPGLRFKSKSSSNIASDNLAKGLSSPSGAAFSNRYDFGASLNAAVQASKDTGKDKDMLYMKSNVRPPRSSHAPSAMKSGSTSSSVHRTQTKPAANVVTPAPGLPSSSYEELVNKYCFFGSKQQQQQSPQEKTPKDNGLKDNQLDGTNGGDVSSALGTKSTAVHHSLHPHSAGRPPISASRSDGFLIPKAVETRPASTALTHLAVPVTTGAPFYGEPATGPERFHWRGDSHATPTIRG